MEDSTQRVTRVVEEYVSPYHIWGALIYLVLFLVAGLALSRMISGFVRLSLAKDRFGLIDPTAAMFLRQLGVAFVWLLLAVLYAHVIPPLRNLGTALLAGVSVAGVVFGLAAQNTLGNVISGVSLLIYRPFKVGDRLQIEAPTGIETATVESLSLGYTTLRTLDNRSIVVPNSVAATRVLVNLSVPNPRGLISIPVTLSRGADVVKVREVLLDVASKIPEIVETVSCATTQVRAQEVEISLRVWCREHALASQVRGELIEQAGIRFAAEDSVINIG